MFAMTFAGREQYDALIAEVVNAVFRDLGCPLGEMAAVVEELQALPTPGIENGCPVAIRFVGIGGSCEMVLAAGPRELWRRSLHP